MHLFSELYDVSVCLGRENTSFPGDPDFSRTLARTHAAHGCEVAALSLSAHAGTHLDLPAHFFPQGKRLDDYAASDFILPARVVEVASPHIGVAAVQAAAPEPGSALLFKTANSTSGLSVAGQWSEDFVSLDLAAAELLVERRVRLVGIDYITIELPGDEASPVHKLLLGHDILILEALNLAQVPPGCYTLICLPLKITRAEAAPVRAVLVR